MSLDPTDSGSGPGPNFKPFRDDGTQPTSKESEKNYISDYLITKFDANISTIREDVKEIKHKVDVDFRSILSDISIGAISSFIVAIVILFVTTNIGKNTIKIFGLEITVFILFSFTIIFIPIVVFLITKKYILRKYKKN